MKKELSKLIKQYINACDENNTKIPDGEEHNITNFAIPTLQGFGDYLDDGSLFPKEAEVQQPIIQE